MNTAVLFLLACALAGLFLAMENRRAYFISLIGAAAIAALYFNFSSLMR